MALLDLQRLQQSHKGKKVDTHLSLGNNTEQTTGAAAGECDNKKNEGDEDLLLLSSPEDSSPGSGMSSLAKTDL